MAGHAADRTLGGISRSRLFAREICWMVLLLTTFATSSKPCAQFRFPTLNRQLSISIQEHSTFTLPFQLDTRDCPKTANKSFYIYVSPADKREEGDFCIVRMMDGKCRAYNTEKCQCTKENGDVGVDFIKNVSQEDKGTWVWRTGNGNVRAEVLFNIRGLPHATNDNNGDESKTPTPAPAGKQSTTKHVHPKTNQGPPAAGDSDDQTDGAKVSNSNKNTGHKSKIQGDKTKRVEDDDKSFEEKINDDTDEKSVDGSVTTGVIVGMVNVVTIIIVVVIVFVLVRRHSRKTRRHPRDSMPPVPNNVMLPGQRQTLPGDVTNKYNTIASTSSHYEVLPVDRESLVLDKDGYLKPASTGKKDITGSYIELVP
ncbi:uncharacterized protein [Littorina saxatilis]|uniref:Uncharacterized protein n=1 Tax=Littorina saxatilis TaxID=31220 RepID=A0AAN9GEK9_9CAEN